MRDLSTHRRARHPRQTSTRETSTDSSGSRTPVRDISAVRSLYVGRHDPDVWGQLLDDQGQLPSRRRGRSRRPARVRFGLGPSGAATSPARRVVSVAGSTGGLFGAHFRNPSTGNTPAKGPDHPSGDRALRRARSDRRLASRAARRKTASAWGSSQTWLGRSGRRRQYAQSGSPQTPSRHSSHTTHSAASNRSQ
jgi:hypothetical protein